MPILRPSPYFIAQRLGRWRWPWLLAGVAASAGGFVVGLALLAGAMALLQLSGAEWTESFGSGISIDEAQVQLDPFGIAGELLLVGVSFWSAAIAGTLVQGRAVRTLLAPSCSFRWGHVGKALALNITLALLVLVVEFVVLPLDSEVVFTGIGTEHLLWLVPMVILVLVQTSGEDVFFKGFLLHRIGAVTKIAWFAPVVVVGVFVSLHLGNPDFSELWLLLPLFILSEILIVFLVVRTGGMEVALVLHWVNNFVIFLIFAERDTQANDLTLFVWETPGSDVALVGEEVRSAVVYLLFLCALLVGLTWRRSPFHLEKYVPIPPPGADVDLETQPVIV